jgi:hypothetical protein
MTSWTITFYRWALSFMRFGLAIAISTGRNPEGIQQLRNDISDLEHTIDLLEIQR